MPNQVSLTTLKAWCRQRADREGDDATSGRVTDAELTDYINQSWRELYDILVRGYQEQYAKASANFNITSATDTYSWATLGVTDFYKALGVDMLVGQPGYYQPLKRFNFAERGMGNPLSPIIAGVPGLYDLRYQLRGDAVVFMQPVPSAVCRLWYIPVANTLVAGGDTIDDVNGYSEFVVLDVAVKVLLKDQVDVSQFVQLREAKRAEIQAACTPRDAGGPHTVADTTEYGWWP